MLVAVVAVLVFMSNGGAPTLEVTGVVKDASTGQPIVGARVFDDGYGPKPCRGATTDANGRYRYMTWPEEHGVAAQAPGYQKGAKVLLTCVFQTEREMVMDFALTRK